MDLPTSTVVDEVPYAEPTDILDRYVRNRDSFTDPGEETVYSMLLDRSDFVDDRTGKAWRRRRIENFTGAEIKFSPNQLNPRKRRRSRFNRTGGRRRLSPQRQISPWVDAQLPVLRVHDIEELVVIRGRNVADITSEGPTDLQADPGPTGDDPDWWIQSDRGRLKIALEKFVRGEKSISGRLVTEDVHIRTTFVYGRDESDNVKQGERNDTSDSVPSALSDAVAKLVAADIAETDQHGSLFRESSGDADLSDTATDLRNAAMEEIQNHRRVP